MSQSGNFQGLRPFDRAAAGRGEAIIDTDGDVVVFLCGPSAKGELCVDLGANGFALCHASDLRMAPLCWVEMRPVYKGDVLYPLFGDPTPFVVDDFARPMLISRQGGIDWHCYPESLSWSEPTVTRGGWAVARVKQGVFENKADAEALLKSHTPAATCVFDDLLKGELRVVRIEWEEPASQKGGAK